MPFARVDRIARLAAAVLSGILTLAMLPVASWGQGAPAAPVPQNTPETKPIPALNYAKPVSHFPNPIGPYRPRHLGEPNLANSARIDAVMRGGKIYLSLNDAIALALENNLDIAIASATLTHTARPILEPALAHRGSHHADAVTHSIRNRVQ